MNHPDEYYQVFTSEQVYDLAPEYLKLITEMLEKRSKDVDPMTFLKVTDIYGAICYIKLSAIDSIQQRTPEVMKKFKDMNSEELW